MKRPSLIIGANSFLGYSFWRRLNAEPNVIFHCRERPRPDFNGVGRFISEDLERSHEQLAKLTPETVYILARPYTSDIERMACFTQHLRQLLLRWTFAFGIGRIVYISSQLVYETPSSSDPLDSNAPLSPKQPYDYSKLEFESFLGLLAFHRNVDSVEIYRIPIVAGPGLTREGLHRQYLYYWMSQYLLGNHWTFENPTATLYGNSWVYAPDLVESICSSHREGHRVANVSSGHFTYSALDKLYKTLASSPQKATTPAPKNWFFLRDELGLKQRSIEEVITAANVDSVRRLMG